MPGIRRTYSGPNGYLNFIPDNSHIVITRDVNNRIIRIDLDGPHGQAYHKIFTRDVNGRIAQVQFWVQDAI